MGINLGKERIGVDSRKGSKTGKGKTARGENGQWRGGGRWKEYLWRECHFRGFMGQTLVNRTALSAQAMKFASPHRTARVPDRTAQHGSSCVFRPLPRCPIHSITTHQRKRCWHQFASPSLLNFSTSKKTFSSYVEHGLLMMLASSREQHSHTYLTAIRRVHDRQKIVQLHGPDNSEHLVARLFPNAIRPFTLWVFNQKTPIVFFV